MRPRKPLHAILRTMQTYGFDIRKTFRAVRLTPTFIAEYVEFRRRSRSGLPAVSSIYPILHEKTLQSGVAGGHYFHQDLWAAGKIFARRPKRHLDIGSRIDGFIAHLLVFMEVSVIDIRPLTSGVANLNFIQEDATELKGVANDSVESLSSLHAAEHFGLGRYGDQIDPEAHLTFMKTLSRILQPGGRLYFSVPVGRERVEFNAHRVLSPRTVLQALDGLTLVSFSAVKDDGTLHMDCSPNEMLDQTYACGLFELTK